MWVQMDARFGDRQLHGGRHVSGDLELEVSLFQVEDKRPKAMATRNPRRSSNRVGVCLDRSMSNKERAF